MGGALLSKPWRDLPENSKDHLDFVKSYQPRNKEAKHLRILLHGPVGSGKSSLINSVDTVLQNRITFRVPTDASSAGSSFTKKYETYKISKDSGGFYSFIFNDTMGFEKPDEKGVHMEDVKLALKGHVKDGYKFKPEEPLKEGDFYNPSPTLEDRVHVLVCVVPADKVAIMTEEVVKKMKQVRLAASDMGIPQLAILTRIDEACPEGKENTNDAYKSKYLKEQVDKFSVRLGIPPNGFFLVKNYHSDTKLNDDMNALILVALRQIISSGEDFLNDQKD